MKQKVIRAGRHSLAVVIPAKFKHASGLRAGEEVDVKFDIENGDIWIHYDGVMQMPLLKSTKRKKK